MTSAFPILPLRRDTDTTEAKLSGVFSLKGETEESYKRVIYKKREIKKTNTK